MHTKIKIRLIFSLVFFLVSLVLINLENQRAFKKILGAQTQLKTEQQNIAAWKQILQERPDYRDGWIQLAAAYYKVGDKEKANDALKKAKTLDPNNEIILNFEKILNN